MIETPRPTPAPDEILVKVMAATVSRTDTALLTASPWVMRLFTGLTRPKEKTLGTDFAGEVEEVGSAVHRFQPGDRVWGFRDTGIRSHAEYMTVRDGEHVAAMPTRVDFGAAVGCIEGPFYADNFLNKVDVSPKSRVLINGATGAIGSALLQLTKHTEAWVTAVGSTPNLELLRSLGADKVVDYLKDDFTQVEAPQTYDFVFDAVGKSSFGRARGLLKEGGIYMSSELGPGNENLYLPLVTRMGAKHRVVFPFPQGLAEFLVAMRALIEEGRYRAVIDRKYDLSEAPSAYEYVASGRKTGVVVLRCHKSAWNGKLRP